MIEKITEVYSDDELEKFGEVAKEAKFKDLDLDKMRKADLVAVIGDLITTVNSVDNESDNGVDQSEEIQELKNQLTDILAEKEAMSQTIQNMAKKLEVAKTDAKSSKSKPKARGMSTEMMNYSAEIDAINNGYKNWPRGV